jgi:hypothetical protein
MPDTNSECYEVIYIPLPKGLFYDPKDAGTGADARGPEAENFVLNIFEGLQTRVGTQFIPPIKFRWIAADGSVLWSDVAHHANAEAYKRLAYLGHGADLSSHTSLSSDAIASVLTPQAEQPDEIDKFLEAMRAAINDVEVPIFVVFDDPNGRQLRFCLRFT